MLESLNRRGMLENGVVEKVDGDGMDCNELSGIDGNGS